MGSPWQPPVKKTSAVSAGEGEDEPDLTGASAGTNDSHFTLSSFHLKTKRGAAAAERPENKLLKQKQSPLDTSAWIRQRGTCRLMDKQYIQRVYTYIYIDDELLF